MATVTFKNGISELNIGGQRINHSNLTIGLYEELVASKPELKDMFVVIDEQKKQEPKAEKQTKV